MSGAGQRAQLKPRKVSTTFAFVTASEALSEERDKIRQQFIFALKLMKILQHIQNDVIILEMNFHLKLCHICKMRHRSAVFTLWL